MRPVLVAFAAALAGCSLLFPVDDLTGGTNAVTSDGGPPPPGTDASTSPDAAVDAGTDAGDRYVTEVLADKPIAYYPLDEASGSVAHDRSGNGNDATFTSAVTIVPGVVGAITSSANNRAIDFPNGAGVDLGKRFGFPDRQPFAVELWVKPRAANGGYRGLFFKMAYQNNQPFQGTYLLFDPDVKWISLQRWVNGASMCTPTNDKTPFPPDAFTHVVVSDDGTAAYIFVNGAIVAQDSQNAAAVDPDVNATMGGGLDGPIDEIAIYDHALTAARVKAHFDAAR